MQVWNVLHMACWKCTTYKFAKNLPSLYHRTTLSGYIFATKACINNWKKLVKQQYLLNMSWQYDELLPTNRAEIGLGVWGTPANFNRFRVLASLLHWHRSTEVNQTSHNLWLSPGLVHYIYTFRGSCSLRNSARCNIYIVSKSYILLYLQHYYTTLEQCASGKLCGVWQGRELGSFCSWLAPPIFRRAAITLGIGPHSSSTTIFHFCYCLKEAGQVLQKKAWWITEQVFTGWMPFLLHNQQCLTTEWHWLTELRFYVPLDTN